MSDPNTNPHAGYLNAYLDLEKAVSALVAIGDARTANEVREVMDEVWNNLNDAARAWLMNRTGAPPVAPFGDAT